MCACCNAVAPEKQTRLESTSPQPRIASGAQRVCPPAAPTTTTRTKQEYGDRPKEHLDVLKQFGITSIEDARELAELTNRIVANLEAIDKNDNDLEAMLEQTSTITGNLKVVDEDDNDFEELERQTGNIAANLKAIEEGLIERGDLDGLAEQTSAIVADLKVIGEEA